MRTKLQWFRERQTPNDCPEGRKASRSVTAGAPGCRTRGGTGDVGTATLDDKRRDARDDGQRQPQIARHTRRDDEDWTGWGDAPAPRERAAATGIWIRCDDEYVVRRARDTLAK